MTAIPAATLHGCMFGETWPDEPDPPFPESVDPFPAYSEPVPEEIGRRARPDTGSDRAYSRDREVVAAVESGYLGLVAVFRVGLFALALGAYLLAFRGGGYYAQVITATGLVTCVYGVHRYLVYRRVLAEGGPPGE
jgi:hypothetical protein